MHIDGCGNKETPLGEKKTPLGREKATPLGEKGTPSGEKETPLDEKVTMIFDAFLALAALISSRGGRWRRCSIAGSEAGATGATWLLGGGRDGGCFCAGAGRAGGRFFWVGEGRAEGGGTWRYVHMTGIWTDPMRTVRSKERARGQKSWRKRDPTWRKSDESWRKSAESWRKSEFCWRKKIHRRLMADTCLTQVDSALRNVACVRWSASMPRAQDW